MMTFSPAGLGRALLDYSDEEIVQTHLADLDQVLGGGFADSVVEAKASRWQDGSPYCVPGPGQTAADPDASGEPGLFGR